MTDKEDNYITLKDGTRLEITTENALPAKLIELNRIIGEVSLLIPSNNPEVFEPLVDIVFRLGIFAESMVTFKDKDVRH